MTGTAEGHASPGGLRLGGAPHPLRLAGALLLLLVVLAACGSTPTGPSASIGSGASAPGPATSAMADPAPASSAAAGDRLAATLEPLRAASSFVTSVRVGDAVVVSASGRSVGDASETSVTTSGRTVDYVRLPTKAWAREAGGSWVVVDATSAPAAPLDVLATPATVATAPGGGDGHVSLVATYPAAALGLKGDPVTVTITADGDAVRFAYVTTASGRPLSSTTTLRPAPTDPIAAPRP